MGLLEGQGAVVPWAYAYVQGAIIPADGERAAKLA